MAQVDVAECCLVCAEPLEWTGIGQCGHQDLCSRCVARMRFVLKDTNCVLCKQESPAVFFTRFLGDYTARVPPEDYPEKLKERAAKGELHHLPVVDGYFDDAKHMQEIKALCGYTHPVFETVVPPRPPPRFSNLPDMRRHIESTFRLSFCDICLTSRKVFVCEQLLYTKSQMERHNREGDESGPLSSSSFKGHPLCKFCRTRFFDSQELWRHMESAHEHCFLCRRAAPDKYVYYRHYKELEDHFRGDHHLCPHPRCLEKKFIVFESDQEIKRHFAVEHGDELKMSRAQRREAFNVPIQLQYRDSSADGPVGAYGDGPSDVMERPGVVIGGGQGIASRHARPGRGGGGASMHHSRSEPHMNSAIQASMDSAGVEASLRDAPGGADVELNSVTFNAADFPSVGSAYGMAGGPSGLRPVGLWTGTGPSSSAAAGGGLNSEEDFPSLPTMSKAQRRRLKEQSTSLAQRLSAAAAPPRVMHRASGRPGGPAGAAAFPPLPSSGAGASSSVAAYVPPPPLASSSYPALGASSSAVSASAAFAAAATPSEPPSAPSYDNWTCVNGSPAAPEPLPPPLPSASEDWPGLAPGPSSAAISSSAAAARFFALTQPSPASAATSASAAAPRAPPPPSPNDFPELPLTSGRSQKSKSKAPAPATAAAASSEAAAAAFKAASERAASARSGKGAAGAAAAAAAATAAASAPSASDFPSLAQVAVASVAASRPVASSSTASSSAPVTACAASSASIEPGSLSDSLKAANRALVDKIRTKLNDEARFASFRQDSNQWLRGNISAQVYYEHMVDLGLLSLVAEMAALCPKAEKQAELMSAHVAFLASPAAQDPMRLGPHWMPPEVALAEARQAEKSMCWSCPRCTLMNAPSSSACEACAYQSGRKPLVEDFPSLGASTSASPSGARGSSSQQPQGQGGEEAQAKGKGGKGKSKGTVLSIGMNRQGTGRQQQQAAPAPPAPNAWGQDAAALKKKVEQQRQLLAAQQQGAAAARGAWSQSGGTKLARSIGAINDAYGG